MQRKRRNRWKLGKKEERMQARKGKNRRKLRKSGKKVGKGRK